MSELTESPLRYRGHRSEYLDIGARGTDEFLGLSVEYAIHPSGIGCLILRFVVHGDGAKPKNYKHLTYRESAQFLVPGAVQSEVFKGYRLNKIAVPVFQPPVKRDEVDFFALKFGVWGQVQDWVVATAEAEGFTITVADLEKEIRLAVVGVPTPEDAIQSVIKFPDLSAPEQKIAALKQVQKPVDEDENEDESDDDDEDGDDEKKDWLN